ncbi:MAG: hypothetical protein WKF43_13035 [Acidimicrobiales bacterium]
MPRGIHAVVELAKDSLTGDQKRGALQARGLPVPLVSTPPGMTRSRYGTIRNAPNDSDAGDSQPGTMRGS